jgi:hypothetical protein
MTSNNTNHANKARQTYRDDDNRFYAYSKKQLITLLRLASRELHIVKAEAACLRQQLERQIKRVHILQLSGQSSRQDVAEATIQTGAAGSLLSRDTDTTEDPLAAFSESDDQYEPY